MAVLSRPVEEVEILFFGGLSVLATPLLMSPFCIFQRCLDLNPEVESSLQNVFL
jgi:hypothetical protein